MNAILKYSTAFVFAASAASAATEVTECVPGIPGCYGTPLILPSDPDTPPPVLIATCETAGGFGLIAFLDDDTALVDRIRALLAGGESVMADVDGTRVTRVSASGAMHVIAVAEGPGGRPVICYQTF